MDFQIIVTGMGDREKTNVDTLHLRFNMFTHTHARTLIHTCEGKHPPFRLLTSRCICPRDHETGCTMSTEATCPWQLSQHKATCHCRQALYFEAIKSDILGTTLKWTPPEITQNVLRSLRIVHSRKKRLLSILSNVHVTQRLVFVGLLEKGGCWVRRRYFYGSINKSDRTYPGKNLLSPGAVQHIETSTAVRWLKCFRKILDIINKASKRFFFSSSNKLLPPSCQNTSSLCRSMN